jgi:hypothetical protein
LRRQSGLKLVNEGSMGVVIKLSVLFHHISLKGGRLIRLKRIYNF